MEMNIELDEQGRPKYDENGDRILYPRQWVPAPDNNTTTKLTPYQRKIIREREEEEKRRALSNTNALIKNASSELMSTPVKTKKTKSKYSDDIPTPGVAFSPISPGFVATPSIFEKPSISGQPSIFEQPYFLDPEAQNTTRSVPKRLFSDVSDDYSFDLLDDYEKGGRRKSRKNKKSRKTKKFKKSKKSRKTKKSRKH
jgi:hypothetical protein